MENYNIYDEVGRGTHSFVYKARRKRSIEYVAVKSTAKTRMDKILNEVQFLHKLDSPFVLKFFNWYESQNHIWLIFEYCIGGDLLNLITQDKRLPEPAIREFGSELVAGLHYLHSNGILFCDLKPANVLIDEFGSLKLADFGLARRIPTKDAPLDRPLAPGSPNYMAPELFQQPTIHSFASDFWALGCVLYEMATGQQAFTHTVFAELAHKIQTETVSLPTNDRDWQLSDDFRDLLHRLLAKDPYRRITWDELLEHSFWNGCLPLAKIKLPQQNWFEAGAPNMPRVQRKATVKTESPEIEEDHDISSDPSLQTAKTGSIEGMQLDQVDHTDTDPHLGDMALDDNVELKPQISLSDESRPASAPVVQIKQNNPRQKSSSESNTAYTSISDGRGTRAKTAPDAAGLHRRDNNDISVYSAQAPAPATAPAKRSQTHSATRSVLFELAINRGGPPGGGLKKLSKLLITVGDCPVQPIAWNNFIERLSLPRPQPGLLPFAEMTPGQLAASDTEILEQHLKDIYINLKKVDMELLQKQALMMHLFECCGQPKLANVIINSTIFSLLIKLLTIEAKKSEEETSKPVLSMICLIIGVLFRFAAFFAPSTSNQLQPLVQTLDRVITQGVARGVDGHTLQSTLEPHRLAMSCLGEMLFYLSSQQDAGHMVSTASSVVISGLSNQDLILRHYSTRTLCNILTNCRDESMLEKLTCEQVILALLRSVVELSNVESNSPTVLNLLTTTTQALVQILRYARSLTRTRVSVRQTTVLLLFAKRNVLRALWNGLNRGIRDSKLSLSIASLNLLNLFLETKLSGGRRDEVEAIEVSRSDLLERVISFLDISAAIKPTPKLDRNNQETSDLNEAANNEEFYRSESKTKGSENDEATQLRAKLMLLLYIGIQSRRDFVDKCLESRMFHLVEQTFAPLIAAIEKSQLLLDPISSASTFAPTASTSSISNSLPQPQDSPTSMLAGADSYLLQCVLNLIKVSIRTSLKLGAECISSSENASASVIMIASTPFKLLDALLANPTCRLQLVQHFASNDNKQFTFFLRLTTKMLTVFPNEYLDGRQDMASIGVALTDILLRLFQCATTEAPEIILVESEVLYVHLLVTLVETLVNQTGTSSSIELAVTSIRVIYLVLLQFDCQDEEGCDHRKKFIRTCLLPRLCDFLLSQHKCDESVWRFAVELLFGVLSSDPSLLGGTEERTITAVIVQVLSIPGQRSYHSLPSSTTKMAKMIMTHSTSARETGLYEVGIVRSLLDALAFAAAEMLSGSLLDLLEMLLQLLHDRYETIRKAGSSSRAPASPPHFDSFLDCGLLITQLCDANKNLAASDHPNDNTSDGEDADLDESRRMSQGAEQLTAVADLASRCLIFSSQLFGDKLNDVLFSKQDQKASVTRAITGCLDQNDAGSSAVVLRVLLTLKNCLRCQSNNNSLVSRWLIESTHVLRLLNRLSRVNGKFEPKGSKGVKSGASIPEQIAKTAGDILRVKDAISPPRQTK